MSEPELSVVQECGDINEAEALRSVLDAHGIDAFIQAAAHVSMVPTLAGVVMPRLMVSTRDLERARELLVAEQAPDNATGDPLEGGICAVHEKQAVALCARCGNFLCGDCKVQGQPPVCESCVAAEALPPRKPASGRTLFFVVAAAILFVLAARFF